MKYPILQTFPKIVVQKEEKLLNSLNSKKKHSFRFVFIDMRGMCLMRMTFDNSP